MSRDALSLVRPLLVAAGILIALPPGPAGAAEPCPFAGQKPGLVVQMYFGQTMRGHPIAPGRWRVFLREVVTARFPDGLTVYDAYGQWKDPAGKAISREKSKVVQIAAEDSEDVRRRIAEISDAYVSRFDQQSVGIVSVNACAAF